MQKQDKKLALKKIMTILLIMLLGLSLFGCSSRKFETKPDYALTEEVTLRFMQAYAEGDIDKAIFEVDEEAILVTESGNMKGKETIAEMLRINIEKENEMEISEKKKIDNSKIFLIINNKIPLFRLAGVDVVKTKETFEVQDGKIVKWEIKHLKESLDLIAKMASGTTGIEADVKDDKIIVRHVAANTPAASAEIRAGDVIQSIDGVKLSEMKYGKDELAYRLIGEVGSKVELELLQGTEVKKVNLKRININEEK